MKQLVVFLAHSLVLGSLTLLLDHMPKNESADGMVVIKKRTSLKTRHHGYLGGSVG